MILFDKLIGSHKVFEDALLYSLGKIIHNRRCFNDKTKIGKF